MSGAHDMFSREQLDILTNALPVQAPDKSLIVLGGLDKDGVKVAAIFHRDGSAWHFRGAYEHDFDGDDRLGAQVLYAR